jgi:hypothetical protein
MFRGPSWDDLLASRFAAPRSGERWTAASRKWKIISSGASSGWPRQNSEEFRQLPAAEIGPLVTCRTVLSLPTVW